MATLEEIKKFVSLAEKAERKGLLATVNVSTKFVNKLDESDSFDTLEQAFEKGVDLSKYEKRVTKSGIKFDLENLIDKKDIEVLRRFITVVDKLSGEISTEASLSVNVHNIHQKLNNAYKKFDEKFETGVKEDIVRAYQKIEDLVNQKGSSSRISKRLNEIREKVKDMI